jgi:uncharacterized membrane protein
MASCSKCGTLLEENASFCGNCGQPANLLPPGSPAMAEKNSGMDENIAGLLCYVLGWVTGLIFLFIDQRPFVRFHAAQSIVIFGGLQIIYLALGRVFLASSGVVGFGTAGMLRGIVAMVEFALWIVLMIKAYQGQKFRVPIVADIADSIAKKAIS